MARTSRPASMPPRRPSLASVKAEILTVPAMLSKASSGLRANPAEGRPSPSETEHSFRRIGERGENRIADAPARQAGSAGEPEASASVSDGIGGTHYVRQESRSYASQR